MSRKTANEDFAIKGFIFEIRASGFSPATIYAQTVGEALQVFRNDCGRGELNAHVDYIICRGEYDLITAEVTIYDQFKILYSRVSATCDGEVLV